MARSSSGEVRIRVPDIFSVVYLSIGEPSAKKGVKGHYDLGLVATFVVKAKLSLFWPVQSESELGKPRELWKEWGKRRFYLNHGSPARLVASGRLFPHGSTCGFSLYTHSTPQKGSNSKKDEPSGWQGKPPTCAAIPLSITERGNSQCGCCVCPASASPDDETKQIGNQRVPFQTTLKEET